MKILITGGAGFIGHNLARQALRANHEVRVIDDLSTGYMENIQNLDIDFRHASILDKTSLSEALKGIDAVVHLAALGSVPRSIKNPVASHDVNASGTLNVLEGSRDRGVSNVIFSSSSSVYGLNKALPKHEREWVRPLSPYAVSKLAAEQYVLAYQQSFELSTLAFRFFNVYGPGQRAGHAYAAVIPTWIDAMLRQQPVWINGDGTNSRDFTFVGTVCRVLLDAIEEKKTSIEPVNLAYGTQTSLNALVEALALATGEDPQIHHREPRQGDVTHSQADNTALMRLFPDIHPIAMQKGLEQTAQWFKSLSEDRALTH